MCSGLIFWFHLAIYSILESFGLIFEVFFVFFKFVVEHNVFFEIVFVIEEERVFDYVGEGHSFFAINHKDSFEKILQFVLLLFKLVFLAEGCQQTERWVGASALNLSFHVMT